MSAKKSVSGMTREISWCLTRVRVFTCFISNKKNRNACFNNFFYGIICSAGVCSGGRGGGAGTIGTCTALPGPTGVKYGRWLPIAEIKPFIAGGG